ncbi:hypothetical protein Tco_0711192 [Tanacetum coccineum]
MYKEYLAEFWVNTLRNAIGAHYLPYFSEYVAPPSIDIVRHWFLTIRYGEEVSAKGTLWKSLIPPRWRLLMAQIIQCLGSKTGGFDQITNKDSIILYSLANGINIDYANIFWEDIINKLKKKEREKVVPYTRFLSLLIMHKMNDKYRDGNVTLYPTQVFSVNNWALNPNQPEESPFTDHMLAICSAAKPVVFKAPKLSSNAERVLQGTKPGAQPGHKKHSTSLKQPSVSSKEATKFGSSKAPTSSKTGHSKKRKESSSAMDSNPSQPPVSTPDVMLQQIPQLKLILNYLLLMTLYLNNKVRNCLTQPTIRKGARAIARQVEEEESSRSIKLEDLAKLVSNVQTSFKDLDSPKDDPVIVVDDSDEDEEDEVHTNTNAETEDTSVPKSSSPSSLPTELKDLPSKFNELTEEVKELKKQVHKLEIELPRDLKEIPTKLEDFTKTVTNLTSQVTELKTLQWELLAKFLSLPVQVASVQAKLKTLDALLSLLLNVTKALNKFAQVLDSASSKAGDQSVPSASQADTMPAEGEKNTNQATIS